MNRRIFLITALLIFAGLVCSCEKKQNDLQQAGIKANVKSIREITYLAVGDKDTIVQGERVTGEGLNNYYATYNKDGYLTKIENYDNMGEIVDSWKFFFDDKGEALGSNYYARDGSLMDSTYYVLDKNGNIIEYYHYTAEGKLKNKILSSYHKHNIVEEKFFDNENVLLTTSYCKYKKGLLIEDSLIDNNTGKTKYHSYYTYDANKNLQSHTIFNSEGKIDSQGIFSTNEHGDIISNITKVPNSADIVYTYTYFYDEKDNWIKKITYMSNQSAYLTIRQIEYYK